MNEHVTNTPLQSLHDWEIGSIFLSGEKEMIKLAECCGQIYRCTVMDGMVDGASRMYWFNGQPIDCDNKTQVLNFVMSGRRLPEPRPSISYYQLDMGSVLLMSNRDIVVVTGHICKEDGTKSLQCKPVASVADSASVVDPTISDDFLLTEYGYSLYANGQYDTSLHLISILHKIKAEDLDSLFLKNPLMLNKPTF
jgi:hypothetical protein